MDRDHLSHSPAPTRTALARVGAALCWLIAALACAWIAWCTAIGPLMRADAGLAAFRWTNGVAFVAMFVVCFGIVWLLVRSAHRAADSATRTTASLGGAADSTAHLSDSAHRTSAPAAHLAGRTIALPPRTARFFAAAGRLTVRATRNWRRIWLVLAIGWLWIPTTLLVAYGADILSQTREFAWAWNQWTGLEQPYIGFFSFVPMDIYPTAHYMWSTDPTYLTDQHNIVLTVIYGASAALSRYLTGSNDAGFVVLAALQWLFAGFCCASAANRFFNLPWIPRTASAPHTHPDYAHPERLRTATPIDFAHPERGPRIHTLTAHTPVPAGPLARALVMLLFLCCPLVTFSTISLTKSPLFAFAFTWWFGLMYELYMTHRNAPARPQRTRPVTIAALVVSCVVMLVSAKYAWYILMIQVVLSLLADRRRWRLYLLTLLLPTVLVHGAIAMLIGSGAIIGGDPIESRGAQLQMIARVAQRNPGAIPESAARKLAPIFNIDQMAQAYRSEDADPVKSSGIQSKKVSYRWRSVTAEDMKQFNAAWLEIVRADPQTAFDALFAKSYGYFDVFDPPYVPMSYYVDNDYVQQSNTWIKHYNHDWRGGVAHVVRQWSRIPVLGWVTHGNFYVTLTLLIGAAELALRRWRALSWHMPLLLLMGVMITAPANNFERHMLPIAFVFGFLCITFARDNRGGSWVHGPARGTAHDSPRA
ncbi:hypothetical protein PG2113B_0271 [Bifidobacterium pseudolongum subsp. globosum]|uniref:Beta-carotene 15,15'-monooxygenase n=1 Tax=Bifidobacterium pseudolongum subsp. globosum TaxID=1690 RepID=A0A4Q5BG35_9BIFI|nr:DUF6020 family protein [Bifidobacterium pseudolongum]RYQ05348.1 hypothetical protein PG2113B_0271 [Bifidobacterium pseudolongum subsp. globosum]RYQ10808.1 hypothetical protein PG2098B_0270 [Bifidobacterium pseudolongum subsp. globosum]RYQ15141.1 hypothetical protein PG2088B_0270 [Bifidobacterium pseudolongum subsp. globosum]RYQ16788.1 hypothetical protein PG2086B_0270 [Bifidobacterium pseudolongum subsp. globosum]RYQ50744.1 hypothetical protein PG1770B_0352 [Bifidobacterium pseudolongum sub